MAVIRVEKLRKVYRVLKKREGLRVLANLAHRQWNHVVALNDIDLSIDEGEIIGYIGPNGAGKSTTIKVLAGVLHPTSGRVLVKGIEPYKHKRQNARAITLIMGQRSILVPELPVTDAFEMVRHIYTIPRERFRRNRQLFCDLLGIDQFIDTPLRQLSLGMRMKVEFATSMMHEPSIAYLDEPTIGLDVVAKDGIRERGMTVVFTSHDVVDIERLCTRVIVIDQGRLVYSGDTETLKHKYCGRNCELRVVLEDPRRQLSLEGFRCERRPDHQGIFFDRGTTSPSDLIYRLHAQGIRLADFSLKEPSFEEAVKLIYRS